MTLSELIIEHIWPELYSQNAPENSSIKRTYWLTDFGNQYRDALGKAPLLPINYDDALHIASLDPKVFIGAIIRDDTFTDAKHTAPNTNKSTDTSDVDPAWKAKIFLLQLCTQPEYKKWLPPALKQVFSVVSIPCVMSTSREVVEPRASHVHDFAVIFVPQDKGVLPAIRRTRDLPFPAYEEEGMRRCVSAVRSTLRDLKAYVKFAFSGGIKNYANRSSWVQSILLLILLMVTGIFVYLWQIDLSIASGLLVQNLVISQFYLILFLIVVALYRRVSYLCASYYVGAVLTTRMDASDILLVSMGNCQGFGGLKELNQTSWGLGISVAIMSELYEAFRKDEQSKLHSNGTTVLNKPFLVILRRILQKIRGSTLEEPLPNIWGGLLAYFAQEKVSHSISFSGDVDYHADVNAIEDAESSRTYKIKSTAVNRLAEKEDKEWLFIHPVVNSGSIEPESRMHPLHARSVYAALMLSSAWAAGSKIIHVSTKWKVLYKLNKLLREIADSLSKKTSLEHVSSIKVGAVDIFLFLNLMRRLTCFVLLAACMYGIAQNIDFIIPPRLPDIYWAQSRIHLDGTKTAPSSARMVSIEFMGIRYDHYAIAITASPSQKSTVRISDDSSGDDPIRPDFSPYTTKYRLRGLDYYFSNSPKNDLALLYDRGDIVFEVLHSYCGNKLPPSIIDSKPLRPLNQGEDTTFFLKGH